ncbi:MAG: ABC transporter permease [Myxococcota bacterium]
MNLLDRKLLRDLLRLKGQTLTIALVVAVGVGSYITLRTTWRALGHARAAYYENYRFADVFAGLKRAPDAVADRLEELPGVSKAYPRIVEQVLLPIDGMITPARGALVSVPTHGRSPLNDVLLTAGRMPEPGRSGEVVVYEPFADAHGLTPGSTLPAILNGKLHDLIVVGVGMSPEFVFAVDPGSIVVDDARYGPLWMSRDSVAAAFQMEGAFNNVVMRLEPGASRESVLVGVDRILKPYGGLGAQTRKHQMSHSILTGELQQIESLVLFLPVVFLAVAAFLLNVVFSRLVALQRSQIAIVKALGYGNATVAAHYLKMVGVIVLLGSIFGVMLGVWMGNGLLDLFAQSFRLPMVRGRVDLFVSVNAILASFAAGAAGISISVSRAVSLPPAEAMRPPAPARYRASAIERFPLLRRVANTTMMVLREIWRRPLRTLVSSLGIAFAVAIVILGRFGEDAMQPILDMEFGKKQREDITVVLSEHAPEGSLGYMASLPGVLHAEGLRMTPVRMRVGPRWRDTVLIGIPRGSTLRRLYDVSEEEVTVPHTGVLVTSILAEVLGAEPNDLIEVELKEGDRSTRHLRLTGTVEESFGLQGYMEKDELHTFLREGTTFDTAMLRVDPKYESELQSRLTDIPRVQSIARKRNVLHKFEGQTRRTREIVTMILTLFAIAIAVAVVYNNARVSLSMRSRDLATLRVLGFTRTEVSSILLGEQALQVLVGVPIGMVFGAWGAETLVNQQADPEQFRLPLMISQQTYAVAVLVIVVSAILSSLLVRRRIDELDLVGVLKTRE